MTDNIRRFAFVTDTHYGFESVGGHKRPLHDPKAWGAALKFLQEFKPQDFFFGGDILDCGAISHHNKHKPRKTEGFRLLRDAEECVKEIIEPIESILPRDGRKVFITGNHCDWLNDFIDENPTLEGMVDLRKLLHLGSKWDLIPQGGGVQHGKLYFCHGDTITGGEHVAKSAVVNYERNIRFGHHHTYQVYTKTSPIDIKLPKTGVAVPCLCSKDMGFMEKRPHRWVQGLLYGYMTEKGPFADHVAVIVNGQMIVNGKIYKG